MQGSPLVFCAAKIIDLAAQPIGSPFNANERMNFLAHFFLSRQRDEWLLGSFLADYLRNPAVRSLPAALQAGVRLHRRIDTYTDQHPEVYAAHGKYAPVVIDVFYDYFLSINWERFTEEPLEDFTRRVYALLQRNTAHMPPRLQQNLPLMVANDWLRSYGTHNGIAYAFERMKRRVSRPEQLEGALDSMLRDHELLDAEFQRFFPDVIALVEQEFPH